MAKLVEVRVTVEGVSPFPIDMLRYDNLVPDAESDSGVIARDYHFRNGERAERVTVVLRRYAEKSWRPTDGRWQSFGWKVVNVEHTGRQL